MSDQSNTDKNEQAYQFLIGILLSVQSTDPITERVMSRLIKDGITIQKYYTLSESEIKDKIPDINFNANKAKFIIAAAVKIVDELKGKVPDTLEGLKDFKGVGNKVANLVLQYAFNKHEGVAVDVHVHRITNRLGWVKSKTPDETMEQLNVLFEKE